MLQENCAAKVVSDIYTLSCFITYMLLCLIHYIHHYLYVMSMGLKSGDFKQKLTLKYDVAKRPSCPLPCIPHVS